MPAYLEGRDERHEEAGVRQGFPSRGRVLQDQPPRPRRRLLLYLRRGTRRRRREGSNDVRAP